MDLLRGALLVLFVGIAVDAAQEEVFLKYIFTRYGGTKGITFEGLEHLMENLGLGGLRFEKSHNESLHRTPDGEFKELHDAQRLHKHNHTRLRRAFKPEEKCLTPQDLLYYYGLEAGHDVLITEENFMAMCPAIVHQLDRRLCSPRAVFNQAPDLGFLGTCLQKVSKNLCSMNSSIPNIAWVYAIISVLIMSVVGLLGVLLVPILDKAFFSKLLSLLGALAVGTLSGDALLHLLPHALQAHPGGEVVITRAGSTFLTLLLFFAIEAAFHAKGNRKRIKKIEEIENTSYMMVPVKNEGHSHSDRKGTSVIWMIITGDGLHNLTDGLAMGAAFRQDVMTGLATALAVFSHELPHELGDFALLLQNGMDLKTAVIYNLASSVLSLIGVVLGLLLADYSEAALWIYAATAGSFLYISLATLIPEMQKQVTSLSHLCIQLIGMFLGGGLMFVIAIYEHSFHEFLKELD
ncbi:zinc transporter ZIP5 [Halyomorpha halys]|uniref:zinc transporter ZIP5 n=1 Tax=Halyomorpha halys TaxID=286706 RepID=UPI0006D4D0AB